MTLATSAPTFAQSGATGISIEIEPTAEVEIGEKFSWFQCPCFRWVVQTQAASGKIETRRFLISSKALFSLRDESKLDLDQNAVHLINVGAMEALLKGGQVGLGFKGVTWGKDRDRGYSDLLRSGLYGLVNLVRSEALRLDIHSGFDFETMRVNLGPQINNPRLDQSVLLGWTTGNRWSGDVSAHVSVDAKHPTETDTSSYGAEAEVRLRIVDFHGLRLGTSLDVDFEHDGFRGDLGLEPNLVSEQIMMSLSYIAGRK